jgi:hypothetical protein
MSEHINTKNNYGIYTVSRISSKLITNTDSYDEVAIDNDIKEINEGSGEKGDFVWIYRNPTIKYKDNDNSFDNSKILEGIEICLTTQQLNAFSEWNFNRFFSKNLKKYKDLGLHPIDPKNILFKYNVNAGSADNVKFDKLLHDEVVSSNIYSYYYQKNLIFEKYFDFIESKYSKFNRVGLPNTVPHIDEIITNEMMYTTTFTFQKTWAPDGFLQLKMDGGMFDKRKDNIYTPMSVIKKGATSIWPSFSNQKQGTKILAYMIQVGYGPIKVALLPEILSFNDMMYWTFLILTSDLKIARQIKKNKDLKQIMEALYIEVDKKIKFKLKELRNFAAYNIYTCAVDDKKRTWDFVLKFVKIVPFDKRPLCICTENNKNVVLNDLQYLQFQRIIKYKYEGGDDQGKYLSPSECNQKLHKFKKKIPVNVLMI